MNDKHKHALDYDSDLAKECEAVLVKLLRTFTSFRQNVRLIGGLVPTYQLGPAAYVNFFALGIDDAEERTVELRKISEMVSYLLNRIRENSPAQQ